MSVTTLAHGKDATSVNHGCRCTPCTDAHAAYQRRANKRRRETPLDENDSRHGLFSTYTNWGCRCEACRTARRARRSAS